MNIRVVVAPGDQKTKKMIVKMKKKTLKLNFGRTGAARLRLSVDRRCPKYEGKERESKSKSKGGGLWRREGE